MGMQLAGNPDAKIITCQINDVFIKSGGCGLTFGLLIASWLSAKSTQMKSITKLATVPGLFNINEPVIFGLPIVFNPYQGPFVLVPLLAQTHHHHFLHRIGLAWSCLRSSGAMTTPLIIAGLLNGWWCQSSRLPFYVHCVCSPFVRAQDRAMLKEEQESAVETKK